MSTGVLVDVNDGIAVVTLAAPPLNLFSRDTARDLSAAYRRCEEDDDVRVVVVTGAGETFCAGADLSTTSTFAGADDEFSASPIDPPAWAVRKLVIAAVNGHAIGVGLSLALQCDLRIVARDARLALPQVRFGVLGDLQSHSTLPRLVGSARAAELLLTGRRINGIEAEQWGLANQAVAAVDVLPTALALAHDVASQASPASVALSKSILNAALHEGLSTAEVGSAETAAHRILMAHPDAVEGARAWQERRHPQWCLKVSDLPDLSWPS